MRKWLVALTGALAVGTWAAMAAVGTPPVHAEVDGPCTGTMNGIDVSLLSSSDPGDAIEVEEGDDIVIVVTADELIATYDVQLEFAGFRWTVADGEGDGNTWTKTVNVDDYARFGVGLYRVIATSAGSVECEGSVLVRVGGSPFGSIAGWAALALTGVGVAAAVAAALDSRRKPPFAKLGFGALGGLGSVALMQQFSVAYPTRTFAVVGVLAGVLTPLAAHQIGRLVRSARHPPQELQPGQNATGQPLAGPSATGQFGQPPAGQQHIGQPLQPPSPATHGSPNSLQPSGATGSVHQPSGPELAGWTGDRVVGPAGLQTWISPDAASGPGHQLSPGVEIRLGQTVGDRILVQCSNGWTAWVAVAALEALRRRD